MPAENIVRLVKRTILGIQVYTVISKLTEDKYILNNFLSKEMAITFIHSKRKDII